MQFERYVENRVIEINNLLDVLKNNKSNEAKLFLQSVKTGAAAEWWPCLRALQTVIFRLTNSPQREIFRVVAQQWVILGAKLDLNEKKERKRHGREAARRCSWCAYYQTELDDSVTLKKCAGCGERQYCSRGCQKESVSPRLVLLNFLTKWNSDWTKGGHKRQCRRLK